MMPLGHVWAEETKAWGRWKKTSPTHLSYLGGTPIKKAEVK